jgi:hypothetical protein
MGCRFEDLDVWKLADDLAARGSGVHEQGSAAKDFKYRDQIRDATSSAARNTARIWALNPANLPAFSASRMHR